MFGEKCMESSSITGTGSFSLGTSVGAFQTWRSEFADGSVVFYCAENGDGTSWEIGYGTLTYGSPDTLSRTLIDSSTGSLISWAVADAPIYIFSAPVSAAMKHLILGGKATARPAWLQYGPWVDSDTPSSAIVTRQFFDGTSDILLGYLDTTLHLNLGLYPPTPQGRLTLTTATPVLTAAVLAATTIYYTPYCGSIIPLYNSATGRFHPQAFAELTNDTTASSTGKAGPAAVTTNSNYDLFVWNDAGTIRLTRGPAWTSDTARGTGAGTTQISRVGGIWTNTVAITNGPGAGLGTYVGTVRSDGSSQINWQPGGVAAGGTAALLNVWNAYNRLPFAGFIGDTADNWSYTTATVRPANNSSTMRVSFVQGLQEDFFGANYQVAVYNSSSSNDVTAGVGLDSTTAFSGRRLDVSTQTNSRKTASGDHSAQLLGFHYLQALEYAGAVGTSVWEGDGGSGIQEQCGMSYGGRF